MAHQKHESDEFKTILKEYLEKSKIKANGAFIENANGEYIRVRKPS